MPGFGAASRFHVNTQRRLSRTRFLQKDRDVNKIDRLTNEDELSRREFLKTSLVTSVAATAVGMAAMGESASAKAELNTENSSVITVTGAQAAPPLRKPWKNAIAVDVSILLLREDLQSHLAILQRDIGYRYCRTYGFFYDEMAIVARRKDGSLAFRWAQVDKVLDALQRLRLRPFMNLSPVPVPLASGTQTVFDWGVNVTPPRDYAEWGQLVRAFARHCMDRYGLDEIVQWYYEVWNEPNINFWTGSQNDYWKLYDVSAAALKAVSPRLRVGGPVSARAEWVAEMIAHCSSKGVPLDFISTHIYPQDEWVQYPDRKGSPHKPGAFAANIVRGVRETVRRSAMPDLEVHLTEWDSVVPLPDGQLLWSENPNSADNVSAAATACDLALAVDGDCDTFCWWEASDVVGQSGIPLSEFSGTYGLLTPNGLPKATFNAFRFLNRLRGGRLELRHEPLTAGCNLLATAGEESLQVLLWYRDLSVYGAGPQQPWTGTLELPWAESAKPVLVQERITAGAGSCYETWQSLGSPQNLSPIEHHLLEVHAAPEAQVFHPDAGNGQVTHDFRLVPGEVVYLELRAQGEVALPTTPLRQELAEWYAARRGAKE
jgi:xylan 1,4-beta-xylosidase